MSSARLETKNELQQLKLVASHEHGSRGIFTVRSCFKATTDEDRKIEKT
jgi:hypothetical protein